MWQRVQTLYFAISTALIAIMFFCNKAGDIPFTRYIPYLILMVIILLLDFLALTVFKHRVFQFRTAILSTIITLALQAWLVLDFIVTKNNPMFHITALFPVVSSILNVMGARNVWADELMVRSASRLRAAKRKTFNSK